ncbi:MAG TPA: hypothetical protein VHV32_03400 [Candidatus Angelobacter sp.]|nr:hypothetical protein [Candidatus Angelobacter sp.]
MSKAARWQFVLRKGRMTIAVTAKQGFTGPFFSAKFLHSQTGGIFEHNVGCTTQHQPYLTNPGMPTLSASGWSSAGPASRTSSGVKNYHA